jgi:hypothetical protein
MTAADCSACFGSGWVHAGKSEPERCRLCPAGPAGGAELAARITAASAVLGDFRRAEAADADWNGPAMPWATWADRLASMLGAVLDVAGHAPALTGQQIEVLGQVLADAIDYRDPGGGACWDCGNAPDGYCGDHAADIDKTDAYLQLARSLGIEVER